MKLIEQLGQRVNLQYILFQFHWKKPKLHFFGQMKIPHFEWQISDPPSMRLNFDSMCHLGRISHTDPVFFLPSSSFLFSHAERLIHERLIYFLLLVFSLLWSSRLCWRNTLPHPIGKFIFSFCFSILNSMFLPVWIVFLIILLAKLRL